MADYGVQIQHDARIYGQGSIGGKGTGLIRINECDLPRVRKLQCYVLATDFYDSFRAHRETFQDAELHVIEAIFERLEGSPIGVRSSATNEGAVGDRRAWALHAGENISFMLPNNHLDRAVRLEQLRLAIYHIYNHFIKQQAGDESEKMAIVINPIPGLFDDTLAGPFYYPYISGVANSFFPHALKTQNPHEGFARIAFGHGYATVLDDFPVISMATIANPIPIKLMQVGGGQQYFYALDMTKNKSLEGEELETMAKLHVRFANFHKIKLLGLQNQIVTIEELIQNDHFGFKTGLQAIMETIATKITSHFQIEFVFNIDFQSKPYQEGFFHVVQLTPLPDVSYESVEIPKQPAHLYLSIANLQGHGAKHRLHSVAVVSPFIYCREMHDQVRAQLAEFNQKMRQSKEPYIILVPGRLGCRNPDWGIGIDYRDVDQAVAIFEYGVDIAGRSEPLPEKDSLTGGIYGSHFLYMIQGGYDEDQKRLRTRMYGSQGTHFLTNIMSNDVFYGYIAPTQDLIDPWFFAGPDDTSALYVLDFPGPVSIYADSISQRCVVVAESD